MLALCSERFGVKGFWSSFRRFWLQEEVPRWIGLSLVVLYTAGLTGVAWTTLAQAEHNNHARLEGVTASALRLLGRAIEAAPADDLVAQQCLLRGFARDFGCLDLRVVDRQHTVLASVRRAEVGQTCPPDPHTGTLHPRGLEVTALPQVSAGVRRALFRMPIGTGPEPSQRFVEGIWLTHRPIGGVLAGQALTLAVILAAVGGLFLLYRRMRQHFRGISRIAENLAVESDILARELDSLRVADSLGAIARPWNSLIDLIEELRAESERSTATDELRRALERSTGGEVAEALNVLPEALLYVGDGGTIRYANSKAAHLLWRQDQADDSPPAADLAELGSTALGHRLVDVIERARATDGSFQATSEVLNDPQDESTYRVRVLPLARQRGGKCLVVVADISQQVQADRAREDFVSQVTHELRTPLTNIRAYAETLSSGMFDDPQVITDCYNVITKETRRLSRLIEDILSISQMEAGNIQLVEDDVDLRLLLSDAVRDLRGLADEKNIDLQMNLPSKLGTIHGDRDKLAVVLNNLLGNALKYTPTGGSVCLGCKMSETELVITVKDTGIGIDPGDHERIFEKFQRADDPAVQEETGTGIGLTTAREIVRRHRGEIELMSAKGEGSTFVVKIPVAPQAAVAAAGAF